MKISFDAEATEAIISKIKKTMENRNLAKIVEFSTDPQGNITIHIKKLGTSTLSFSRLEEKGKAIFKLSEEKIAFAHRAFKDEVTQKIMQVIELAGGKIG